MALRSLQRRDDGGAPYYSIQLWKSGNVTTLGTALGAQGYSLNNLGQVASNNESGLSYDYVGRIWSVTGITDMSSDGAATVSSINDVGHAAGTYGSDSTSYAYIWDGKTLTELTTPGAVGGIGYGINDSDQVLGLAVYQTESEGSTYHYGRPVVWQNGTVSFLDEEGFDAWPYKINNAGQVLGYYSAPDSWVLWSNGATTTPVNGLAYGLNDMGQVVGSYLSEESQRAVAFLWQNGSMVDLNSLIQTGSSNYLMSGMDINSSGQILAIGYSLDANGQEIESSFLLTPVSEPSSILVVLCGIGGLAWRRKRQAWSAYIIGLLNLYPYNSSYRTYFKSHSHQYTSILEATR